MDHFSCFAALALLLNKSASVVPHALISQLLCPCTTSSVLLNDNGTEFKKAVLQSNLPTVWYYSVIHYCSSNGLVEPVSRKIVGILRHVANESQEPWQDWLPHEPGCINGSMNASTGKMPYYVVCIFEESLLYDLVLS